MRKPCFVAHAIRSRADAARNARSGIRSIPCHEIPPRSRRNRIIRGSVAQSPIEGKYKTAELQQSLRSYSYGLRHGTPIYIDSRFHGTIPCHGIANILMNESRGRRPSAWRMKTVFLAPRPALSAHEARFALSMNRSVSAWLALTALRWPTASENETEPAASSPLAVMSSRLSCRPNP